MSVEEVVNQERERIIELDINESAKENMLKSFDETISLYKGKDGTEEVAGAIVKTATRTRSEEIVKETAKILRSDEIIKTIDLYQDIKIVKEVAKAIQITAYYTESEEAVIEIAKILKLYHNKKEAENVTDAIRNTADYTESGEAVIETAKTLKLYHDKKEAEKIAKAIISTAKKTMSEEAVIETAKKLRNVKDIYNLKSKLFSEYIDNISNNLSKNIKSSLSLKGINSVTKAYTITLGFCKLEGYEFKNKVISGFFYHLNKATDKGKTIDDKLKIMNKWSDNVYTTFKDHPEDFMEFIR